MHLFISIELYVYFVIIVISRGVQSEKRMYIYAPCDSCRGGKEDNLLKANPSPVSQKGQINALLNAITFSQNAAEASYIQNFR